MSAPQFFVDDLRASNAVVVLSPDDSRHALRSLRLRAGELVTLADGRGGLGRGRLAHERDGLAVIQLDEVSQVTRPGPFVSVGLAPPKGDRLAWAVQKLAELGVDEMVLFESERSVRTWRGDRAGRALERLSAVAREAAMQSRRPFLMEIAPSAPVPFREALHAGDSASVIVLWERASEPLSDVLLEPAGDIRLLVGPEGGFGEGDVATARAAGVAFASLGGGILRTETAAVAAAAIALSRLGRLG